MPQTRLTTLPLFGRGYASKSPSVTTQKLINGYRDVPFDPDKSNLPIFGSLGLTLLYTLAGGAVRGGAVVNGVIYAVSGAALYSISSVGVITNLGAITTAVGAVYFTWNGTQLMFVDGSKGWVFTPGTGVLAQIVDVDFPTAPTTCTWIGGYGLVTNGGTGKINISAINNFTAWNGLDFFTAETAPDNVLRVEVDHGQINVFGETTTEFWALSGTAAIVARVGGAGIEWGCVSAQTVTKFASGLSFLAQNRLGEVQAGQINGYQFVPFSASDPDINNALNNRSRTNLAAATAFSYFVDGHAFYQLNFPDASYVYDAMGDDWSGASSGTPFGSRHYANIRLTFAQQPWVTDYRNGNIYLLDKTVYSDAGDAQQFELTSKHIFDAGNFVSVNELAVEIEAGDGLTVGQGSDPQMMASWSKDGGRTWGNEIWRSMGPIGKYKTRAVWRNLGRAKDWAFKFRISDPIPRKIVAATVELEP